MAGCSKVIELLNNSELDYIINNAAINHTADLVFNFDPAALAETIQCNITGPALVMRFLLPAIERGSRKAVINISSPLPNIRRDLGPISTTTASVKHATYKQMCKRPDFIPILMDPSWVKTDNGWRGWRGCKD